MRSELSDDNIRTAIKNSGGVRGSLLIPDAPFELLVRRAIARLLQPCLQCKDFVHAELLRIAAQCTPPDIARFPKLQARAPNTAIRSCYAVSQGASRFAGQQKLVPHNNG